MDCDLLPATRAYRQRFTPITRTGGIGSALVTDEIRRWRERDLPVLHVYGVPALLVHCYR